LTFFLFAKGSAREIGRGGRYVINLGEGSTEPATGATLFVEALLPVVPQSSAKSCVYVPAGTKRSKVNELHTEGYRVRVALSSSSDEADAKCLGCSYMLIDGAVVEITN